MIPCSLAERRGPKHSFIYKKASQRRRRNTILRIKNQGVEWDDGEEEDGRVTKEFFVDLFSSASTSNMHHVI